MPAAATAPFDLNSLTREVYQEVERLAPAIVRLSRRIHGQPELGLSEHQAVSWCAELLADEGFTLARPVAGMDTAFRARRGSGRPAVAFLAEYDALPGVGHACGHNIIAASAVGAGVALAQVLDRAGLGGTVLVDGTPAEETVGGKIPFVGQGLYREVDVALSMHPDVRNSVGGTCLAVKTVAFTFTGRAAHAAAEPEKGVNALDAVIQTYNNINALRQHVKSDVRIHGVITDGGRAPNIVPDRARAEFYVRSADLEYFKEVLEKVRNCARGAALATGAKLEIAEEAAFEPTRENRTLNQLVLQAMAESGIPAEDLSGRLSMGSTDFGNVSQAVPAAAPTFRIAPPGTTCHHQDFADAAGSTEGDAAAVNASRVLAAVGLRLIVDPGALRSVRAEFAGGEAGRSV